MLSEPSTVILNRTQQIHREKGKNVIIDVV
jgi:hypothetical protein